MKRLISQKDIFKFIERLKKTYKIIAPLNKDGEVIITELEDNDPSEIELSEFSSALSWKEFCFPQIETIMNFSSKSGISESKSKTKKRLFFGIRPCDVNGIFIMDIVFSDNYKDTFYLGKRKNNIIVVINCNTAQKNCFCNLTGTGPFLNEGFDILLTKLNGVFLVETASLIGEDLIRKNPGLFKEAEEADINKKEMLYKNAMESFSFKCTSDISLKMDAIFEERLWEEISYQCLRCGGCSYVCPTCYCFNVIDRKESPDYIKRNRLWDSCLLEGYSRMAQDTNPRPEKEHRIKQFFYHKLNYFNKRYNRYLCVGCGRCANTCIGYINILEIIKEVVKK